MRLADLLNSSAGAPILPTPASQSQGEEVIAALRSQCPPLALTLSEELRRQRENEQLIQVQQEQLLKPLQMAMNYGHERLLSRIDALTDLVTSQAHLISVHLSLSLSNPHTGNVVKTVRA